jgi:hypothetical protein
VTGEGRGDAFAFRRKRDTPLAMRVSLSFIIGGMH